MAREGTIDYKSLDAQLIKAVIKGNPEEVKVCIYCGANVNNICPEGKTPLHFAAANGHLEIVKLLLRAGANPNALDDDETPLHVASIFGNVDAVKELLEAGADVNAKDNRGVTPLELSVDNGHADVVNELLKAGARVDDHNTFKQTPLHIAARRGFAQAVEAILRAGADVSATDYDGKTPFQEAMHQHAIYNTRDLRIVAEILRKNEMVDDAIKANFLRELLKNEHDDFSSAEQAIAIFACLVQNAAKKAPGSIIKKANMGEVPLISKAEDFTQAKVEQVVNCSSGFGASSDEQLPLLAESAGD